MALSGPPAQAEHFCREEARSLHRRLLNASSETDAERRLRSAAADYPECGEEFVELLRWYERGGQGDFPFARADDPAHSFAGPLGWWWNTVWVDMLGRDTFLMLLFGWTVLMLPLVPVGMVVAAVGAAGAALVDRRRRGSRSDLGPHNW